MPLSDHVQITIQLDTLGVSRAGFGVPMILSYNAPFVDRTRDYSSIAEVATDFADADSPERLAAAALFGQDPHPSKIKIGRGENIPTQRYTLSVANVRNSHTYQIQVEGQGVTSTLVEFTSDASATDGEIVAGLVAALNGVTGKNFTANGATSPFTVTGDTPGDWFSLEVKSVDDLSIVQDHADSGVANDLIAISLVDDDWYALYTLYNSRAYVGAAAAHIETQKKIYAPDVNESNPVTLALASGDDTLDDLFDSSYSRTFGVWHESPAKMAAATWLGRVLPLEPGSTTWKFKSVSGLTPSVLTSTQRKNLVDRNANFYERVAGVPIFSEGTTADGDYIDVQRGLDFLEDDMTKRIFETLAGADKIPYTDEGVAVIENDVRGSLQLAVDKGILASDPPPDVDVPLVASISTVNKANRTLPDVKFSATLAGAIHKVNLSGVITL